MDRIGRKQTMTLGFLLWGLLGFILGGALGPIVSIQLILTPYTSASYMFPQNPRQRRK